MSDERHLITAHEAGAKLRMLSGRVTRLANRGAIPCVRLPDGELRFDPVDIDRWIDNHKEPAKEFRKGEP